MRIRLTLVCLALAVQASAQSFVGSLDLAALGYGQSVVRTVEADGNPATVELLAVRNSDGLHSVGAIRGTACAGAWFNPRAGLPVSIFASVAVQRLGDRDVLIVREANGVAMYAVGLTVPGC